MCAVLFMKKRLIAIGMCVVMACSMAGCSKKKSNSGDKVGRVGSDLSSDAAGSQTEETPVENTQAVMTGTDYKARSQISCYQF